MKKIVTLSFAVLTLTCLVSASQAQSSVTAVPHLKASPISAAQPSNGGASVTSPWIGQKFYNPGTPIPMASGGQHPLSIDEALAYYDSDSEHTVGGWKLPDTTTINGNEYQIYAYDERFTTDIAVKGAWYLDSAMVIFAAPNVPANPGNKITVYAIRPTVGGNGYQYPFGAIFDSASITPDMIPEPDSFHVYTVKFHHKRLTNPSFFLQISVGQFSENKIIVFGDQITNQDVTPRELDTTVDRSYWSARQIGGDTTYAGFQGGRFITTADQFVIYPNFAIIAMIGNPTASGVTALTPDHFALDQNSPNSATASTKISYTLYQSGPVSLKVYNTLGQEIATLVDRTEGVGSHSIVMPVNNLPNGTYFYTLRSGSSVATRSMTVAH